MRLICTLLLCLSFSSTAKAADVVETAQNAAQIVASARQQLSSARTSKAQIKALTEAIRAYEVALVAMQGGLRELRRATVKAQTRYTDQKSQVEKALVALQAMGKSSPAKRVWHPAGALASIRAGMILSDMVPVMSSQADSLRAELSALSTLIALQESAESDIKAAHVDLRIARDDLQRAIVVKTATAPPPEDRVRRLDLLARSVVTLEEMAEGLGAIPPADLVASGGDPEIGTLRWPVAGEVLRKFEEPDATGIARPGMVLTASPKTLVVAPTRGEVSYAGQFQGLGRVVVLELSENYILLMVGLGQTLVVTGDIVEKGAPIGLLSGSDTSDEEFLINMSEGTGAFLTETLYIELRENGIAINPADWFKSDG